MSSSNQTGPSRKSKGRQKVTMVKMENQSNLQVTFSKRRAGLFKKASELCTLCGAEAAIVVFSPADKAYCFGHPNLKAILDRVSEGVDPHPTDPRSRLVMEAHRNSAIRQLNVELTRAEGLLKAEKRRAQEIEAKAKASQMTCPSLEGCSYEELCMLKESILGFKKKLDAKVLEKHMVTISDNAPALPCTLDTANNATKLTLRSGEYLGFNYSNGGIGGGAPNPITSSDDHYGMFNFVGAGSSGSLSSMLHPHSSPPTTAFGFTLGHDHTPGFF